LLTSCTNNLPDIFLDFLELNSLCGVDTLSGNSLLLGEGRSKAIMLLNGGKKVVVGRGNEAVGLLEDALKKFLQFWKAEHCELIKLAAIKLMKKLFLK
jgi:hypothetical protein